MHTVILPEVFYITQLKQNTNEALKYIQTERRSLDSIYQSYNKGIMPLHKIFLHAFIVGN